MASSHAHPLDGISDDEDDDLLAPSPPHSPPQSSPPQDDLGLLTTRTSTDAHTEEGAVLGQERKSTGHQDDGTLFPGRVEWTVGTQSDYFTAFLIGLAGNVVGLAALLTVYETTANCRSRYGGLLGVSVSLMAYGIVFMAASDAWALGVLFFIGGLVLAVVALYLYERMMRRIRRHSSRGGRRDIEK